MKTAMQELIGNLIEQKEFIDPLTYGWVMNKAVNLIETEKQQIIDAYHINPKESKYGTIGIAYYNGTFK